MTHHSQNHRFSLRKSAFGLCSVLLASFAILGAETAQADQLESVPAVAETVQMESLVETNLDVLSVLSSESIIELEHQESVADIADDLLLEELGEEAFAEPVLESEAPLEDLMVEEILEKEESSLLDLVLEQEPELLFSPGQGVIGDDYPDKWKSTHFPNYVSDDFGMYRRYCTSFVAHRLHVTNGFTLPRGPYGDATTWGDVAKGQGYRVDKAPVRGSVAWGLAGNGHSLYGHVAWVSGVTGDNITIEEYNYFGDGRYHTRTVHKNSFTGYIHFKDLDLPAVDPSQPARGDLRIQNHNTQTGEFDVVITNVSNGGGVREVRVPIWSEKGGQDDIVWYQAEFQGGSTYKVNVKSSNHRYDTGNYHIHVYYIQQDGQQVGVTNRTFEVKRGQTTAPTAKIDINKTAQNGGFDVVLSQVTHKEDVEKVLVPIWSEKGGQDDIVWYEAKRQGNGSYKVSVDISKHRYDTGLYHVHTYLRQYNEELVGAGTTQTTVELPKVKTGARLVVQKQGSGSFDLIVSNVSHDAAIADIQIPTWSEKNGQDDIVWYNALAQGDGTYKVSVDVSKHQGDTGLYHAHLYFRQADGKQVFVTSTTTTVEQSNLAPSGTYHFTKTLPIKSQASMSSATLDHYYAGESVNYDRVLMAEGRQWISYRSYGGARRYIPLN